MTILLENLERRFNQTPLLRCESLSFPATGCLLLEGPNGSGKTTLLRILSTLTAPSAGQVRVHGHSVDTDGPRVRALVGAAFAGDGGFFSQLSGKENLDVFGRFFGLKPREISARIEKLGLLNRLPAFEKALHSRVGAASTGMRQSLNLARALLNPRARVLLLDEPTRGLDERNATGLRTLLRELARERAVLFSSHLPGDRACADKIWSTDGGRLTGVSPQ